ncbi:hypothetical protein K474DRAFT_1581732, partial [Panus rudis PR-1116 ss-1]
PGDFRLPSPGPSVAMHSDTSPSMTTTTASSGGILPSAKEREAAAARGLHVANDEGPSGVVVHQDGGRLEATPEEEDVPNEIPPSYDSIPRDQR